MVVVVVVVVVGSGNIPRHARKNMYSVYDYFYEKPDIYYKTLVHVHTHMYKYLYTQKNEAQQ